MKNMMMMTRTMIILVMTVTMMMKVEESLTGRVIAAHGDIVRKLHNVEEAQRARDAFTKVGMMLVVGLLLVMS